MTCAHCGITGGGVRTYGLLIQLKAEGTKSEVSRSREGPVPLCPACYGHVPLEDLAAAIER